MEKLIFHVDVNAAFLSWEAVYRLSHEQGTLDLREIPSAVGGDKQKRSGIILAKSTQAKRFGIQTGEPLGAALKKCPSLVIVPPHYNLYEQCSAQFFEILNRFAPVVEKYSVDEAYCDMTGTNGLYGSPVVAANLIKDTIHRELGFTVNVGISNNKLLAKMAGDLKKPDMVHTLFPAEIKKKMWPLPVSELFFVGRGTTKKLLTLGIRTIGDLANADPSMLRAHLNKHGAIIHMFANGIDPGNVVATPPDNKGYGNSATIPHDIKTAEEAKLYLLSISETVSTRLRKDNAVISVVSVSITFFDFTHISHQETLSRATNVTTEIYQSAVELFEYMWDKTTPIRQLGVHTAKAKKEDGIWQMDLFHTDFFEREKNLERAVDEIRGRFGNDSIKRACFVNHEVYHMIGGVGREKLSVDYDKVEVQ
ncbi:MAG: polymerase [Clostridiales bacterium]|nr:polymerase [Clostridiales bacterium]